VALQIVYTFAKLSCLPAMAVALKEMIRSGESSQVEFKKTLPLPEKIAKTLVSFANSRGGHILVGVQDDKYVTGITDAEEEKYVLQQAIHIYTEPPVAVEVEELQVFGKSVLQINVPESLQKPHKAQNGQGEWTIYIRSGDQCTIASPLVIKSFKLEKEGRDSLQTKAMTNNELALFTFLDKQKRITLKDYAKLINVSKRRAYKILIDLTLRGKLLMHDMERTIFFTRF